MNMESQDFPLPSAHIMHILQKCSTTKKIRKLHGLEAFNHGLNSHILFGDDSNEKCEGMFKSRCPERDNEGVLKHSRFDVFMVDLGV